VSLLDAIIGSKRPPEQKNLAVTSPPSSPLSPAPVADVTEVKESGRNPSRPYLSEHPSENLHSGCPPESLDAEARFNQAHAKPFPLLGRKVWTPRGPGTLLQVFAGRVTVLLDADLNKCSFFSPTEIRPVSPELNS
jgi:hypothetical protein